MLKILYIIAIFLFASPYVTAYEYRIATEDDINKLFEETKVKPGVEITRDPYNITIADVKVKPGVELAREPYNIIIAGVYGQSIYHFTDTGHFAHPSVVIERHREYVGISAREREHIEKWIQVIEKPYIELKRINRGVDPRPICIEYDLQSRPQEAVKCYEKVAKNNPDSVEAQLALGVAYIYADDEQSTRKQYEILKKQSLSTATIMLVGFGIAAGKPEWLDYYEKDKKRIEKISEAQRLLDSLGYDTGLLVGAIVPKLEAAIRAFQLDADLPVNGEVTEPLLEKLRIWKK